MDALHNSIYHSAGWIFSTRSDGQPALQTKGLRYVKMNWETPRGAWVQKAGLQENDG